MNERFDEYFYGDKGGDPGEPSLAESINNEVLIQKIMEQLNQPEFLQTVLNAMSTNNAAVAK